MALVPISDLTGDPAEAGVYFAVLVVDTPGAPPSAMDVYYLDITGPEGKTVMEPFEKLIDAGTGVPVGALTPSTTTAAPRPAGPQLRATQPTSGRQRGRDNIHAKARAWAQANDIEVEPRGRVPQSIVDRYLRSLANASGNVRPAQKATTATQRGTNTPAKAPAKAAPAASFTAPDPRSGGGQ